MEASLHPGVTFCGGTSEFVSIIRTSYYSRWGSPADSVTLVEGWENPAIIHYKTMDEALKAADQVWEIEGFHTSIEVVL